MTDLAERLRTWAAIHRHGAIPADHLVEAADEIERLRATLEIIAGRRQCLDNLMSNVDVACAALDEAHLDDTMDWATREIASGVLESPLARNDDGSPMTLRQLLNKAKAAMTDIVARLHEGPYGKSEASINAQMREAAIEIEQLRAEVAKHEAQIERLIRIGSEHPITFVPQQEKP